MIHKHVKVVIVLFILLNTILFASAQDLINLIPKDAVIIGIIDIGQLKTKADFDELAKLPVMEKLNKEMTKEIFRDYDNTAAVDFLNLKKYGINTSSKAYFYLKTDNMSYGALIFNLENETSFSHLAKSLANNENGIQSKTYYKYVIGNKLNIVWNTNTAAIFGVEISRLYRDSITNILRAQIEANVYNDTSSMSVNDDLYNNDDLSDNNSDMIVEEPVEADTSSYSDFVEESYSDTASYNYDDYYSDYKDPYTDMYNKVNQMCDSIEKNSVETIAGELLRPKGIHSISSMRDYQNFLNTAPDAAIIFDYGQFMFMNSARYMFGSYAFSSLPYTFLMDYYLGTKVFAKVEHNQDDIKFSVDVKHSSKMAEMYQSVKKTNISKKFLKYLDNDLMGYYAMGVDIEGISKGFDNVIRNLYPKEHEYGSVIPAALDVIDIFIDEQAIYNVFTGDMVVALNGIKPVKVPHITYDYDENYNMTEKQDTVTQMQPEILGMVGIGNINDVNKFLKLFISLKLLKQEGNLYTATYRDKDLPVFLSISDDILFISNNKNYVQNPVVYPKNKQLGKNHFKMFSQNTMVSYADISKIVQYFANNEDNSREAKMFSNASGLFSKATLTGYSKKESSNSSLVLELSKTSDNSIVDIIKFFNSIYITKSERFD